MISILLLAAAWQQGEGLQVLEGRVLVAAAGAVEIDRGRSDGLQEGDVVSFLPPGAPELRGEISGLSARSATVRVEDPDHLLEPGTRWQCRIPVARLNAPPSEEPGVEPEHPPWEQPGLPWPEDRPLLAPVATLDAEDRAPHFRGRLFSAADSIHDRERDSSSLYLRFGADLEASNLLGFGEEWSFDGEFVNRTDSSAGEPDETESDFRLDRLALAGGGDRSHAMRWEAGRFLHEEFPEFGVVDGVELGWQLPNGHRFGASAGWLPQLFGDYDTGTDMQSSVFYRAVGGKDFERSLGAGFQKTWHDGESDRDLLLLQGALQPRSGFFAHATAWVDLYGSGDALKSAGAELTRLIAMVGSRNMSGDGWNLTGSHYRYPDLLQETPAPTLDETVSEGSLSRLDLSGYTSLTAHTRGTARVNAWTDEDGSGGGGELRWDVLDFGGAGSRAGAALFANQGSTSDVYGLRADTAWSSDLGRWSLMWESAQNTLTGVSGAQGDLLQHRARAGWDLSLRAGWSFSLFAEQAFGDEQDAQSWSLYLQKYF
jgi:hypothetical protein